MPRQPLQQQRQRPQHQRPRTAAAIPAEIRARDGNLQLQLALVRRQRRAERDRQAWGRDHDRRERDLLLDLAGIMDCKLSPSIDDWCQRRRVRQVSRLPEPDPLLTRLLATAATAEASATTDHQPETPRGTSTAAPTTAVTSEAERCRILETKRSDWLGLTSVTPSMAPRQQRPQTAGVGAAFAASGSGSSSTAAAEARRRISIDLVASAGSARRQSNSTGTG